MLHRILILSVFLQGTFALAASPTPVSAVHGTVLGVNGKPLSGVEIRIQRRDVKEAPMTIKTDAKGYYAASPVPVGAYRVSVIVDGAVRFAADNLQTRAADATRADFNLRKSSFTLSSAKSKKTRTFVWVDDGTGTNTGGHWTQTDASGNAAPTMYNANTTSAEYARELQRRQTNGNFR